MYIYPMKTNPLLIDKVWGGSRFYDFFGIGDNLTKKGECIEISSDVRIAEGKYAGLTADQLTLRFSSDFIGEAGDKSFPFKFKLVDTHARRTPRVHPDDVSAPENKGHYEMIIILHAEPNSGIYAGLKDKPSENEYIRLIKENHLSNAMYFYPAAEDDTFIIPGGLLHAIGGGILCAIVSVGVNEEYQSDFEGAVESYSMIRKDLRGTKLIGNKESIPFGVKYYMNYGGHFNVCRTEINGISLEDNSKYLRAIFFSRGEGTITAGGEERSFKPGDSYIIPASAGEYTIKGNCKYYIIG